MGCLKIFKNAIRTLNPSPATGVALFFIISALPKRNEQCSCIRLSPSTFFAPPSITESSIWNWTLALITCSFSVLSLQLGEKTLPLQIVTTRKKVGCQKTEGLALLRSSPCLKPMRAFVEELPHVQGWVWKIFQRLRIEGVMLVNHCSLHSKTTNGQDWKLYQADRLADGKITQTGI